MLTFASLISGSSGNSAFLSDGKTNILIDCGMSGKRLCESLENINADAHSVDALLITHEHTDHVAGAGVVSRKYNIPIYATAGTHNAMSLGKIKNENIRIVEKGKTFEIGSIGVNAFSIPHDAADPVGYTFFADGEKVSVATDIGVVTDEIENQILGSSMVLLEANHDVQMLKFGSYPYELKRRILGKKGHLSNDSAAQTALKLVQNGAKKVFLGHLSHENNTPDIAFMTVENILRCAGVKIGSDVVLGVAKRSEVTVF